MSDMPISQLSMFPKVLIKVLNYVMACDWGHCMLKVGALRRPINALFDWGEATLQRERPKVTVHMQLKNCILFSLNLILWPILFSLILAACSTLPDKVIMLAKNVIPPLEAWRFGKVQSYCQCRRGGFGPRMVTTIRDMSQQMCITSSCRCHSSMCRDLSCRDYFCNRTFDHRFEGARLQKIQSIDVWRFSVWYHGCY